MRYADRKRAARATTARIHAITEFTSFPFGYL